MSRARPLATGLLAASALSLAAGAQEPPLVERVEIAHNRHLAAETLLFYVFTKPGDRYDEQRLQDDFRRLLDTGFLDDLRLEVTDGDVGKRVVFDVTERRRIRAVEYRGSKALTTAALEDELKTRDADQRVDAFYDDARARRAEVAILEMLTRKGRRFGTVKRATREAGAAGIDVSFAIDDGPRTKLKEVVFTGNRALPDHELRKRLKGAEDVEGVRELYLDHGYVTAAVGPLRTTYLDAAPGASVRWMRQEVPIEEGDQYRVGQVKLEGLTVFDEEEVRPLFGLTEGDVYDESKIRKGYEKLREMYGRRGYVQWTASTRRTPDPARKVVDLVLAMNEDQRYVVGQIRFAGNSATRDRVIRREVFLNEGDVFDAEVLRQGIRRINQLGYFEPLTGPPVVAPGARGDEALDVTFKVQERSGTRYNFGGGTSDTEGTFLNASFASANFLGLGETVELLAQAGPLVRDLRLSLTEPYVLGRPLSAGFEVWNRKLSYRTETDQGVQGYVDRRTGGGLTTGVPIGKWSRLSLGYSYQVVDIALGDATSTGGAALVNPIFIEGAGRRKESTVRPSLLRNTVDDLFMPRRGTRLSLSIPVTGGPLGGSLDFVKPDLEAVAYVPHTSWSGLGLRAAAGFVLPFGDTARIDPATGRNQLPFDQRFYLGGENQIRGYAIRSVGPRDASGEVVGGNKYLLFNAEYYLDVVKPVRLLLFYDAGQAYADGAAFSLGQLRTSTGIEARITVPVLKLPFRFIYAVNPSRDPLQPARAFKFAIGTTF